MPNLTPDPVRALKRLLDYINSNNDDCWQLPVDSGCPDCTAGTVPNNLNTGPCPWHMAVRTLAEHKPIPVCTWKATVSRRPHGAQGKFYKKEMTIRAPTNTKATEWLIEDCYLSGFEVQYITNPERIA